MSSGKCTTQLVLADQWQEAEREWAELFATVPSASPYLAPSWVRSYVDTFADKLHCEQLRVRDDHGTLVGICLLTRRIDKRALLPLRRAYLNTAGEPEQDSVVVEHNAVLCMPTHAADVYKQVAAYLEDAPVDELQLSGATEAAVEAILQVMPGWRSDIEWRDSPCVDLDGLRQSGGDHLAALSRNTREQIRRSVRKYREFGELRLEVAGSLAEANFMFDEMVAMHETRWKSVGQLGGFSTPARRLFHRAFIRHAFQAGQAQLLRVRAGDTVLGVLYNLVANGHVCFYQSGMRVEESNQLKPGLVTHHMAIQHYLEAGCRLYDFLPSSPGEGRYKSSLATSMSRVGTALLQRPGWRRQWFDAARSAYQFGQKYAKP